MEWGNPVWWGWFLLFSRSGGHKTKETYPTRPGSPTPCKQDLIELISKKPNCTCSTLFPLISKKQICTCSTLFCLSLAVVLHDYNAALFCTTKTSNVLVTHYFLWRNCRMCLPNILFPVFMFAFIFHCRSFSPCWPLAFLIFSPPL